MAAWSQSVSEGGARRRRNGASSSSSAACRTGSPSERVRSRDQQPNKEKNRARTIGSTEQRRGDGATTVVRTRAGEVGLTGPRRERIASLPALTKSACCERRRGEVGAHDGGDG